MIRTNEGLSRTELRALERRGIVRKLMAFGSRKYLDAVPSIHYMWALGDSGLREIIAKGRRRNE